MKKSGLEMSYRSAIRFMIDKIINARAILAGEIPQRRMGESDEEYTNRRYEAISPSMWKKRKAVEAAEDELVQWLIDHTSGSDKERFCHWTLTHVEKFIGRYNEMKDKYNKESE